MSGSEDIPSTPFELEQQDFNPSLYDDTGRMKAFELDVPGGREKYDNDHPARVEDFLQGNSDNQHNPRVSHVVGSMLYEISLHETAEYVGREVSSAPEKIGKIAFFPDLIEQALKNYNAQWDEVAEDEGVDYRCDGFMRDTYIILMDDILAELDEAVIDNVMSYLKSANVRFPRLSLKSVAGHEQDAYEGHYNSGMSNYGSVRLLPHDGVAADAAQSVEELEASFLEIKRGFLRHAALLYFDWKYGL